LRGAGVSSSSGITHPCHRSFLCAPSQEGNNIQFYTKLLYLGKRSEYMILNNYPLENEPIIINTEFLSEKRDANHIVKHTSDLTRLNTTQSKITITTEVLFKNRTDNIQLVKAVFKKSFDLDNDTPVSYIYGIINEMRNDLTNVLLKRIPVATIDITPPLVAHYEMQEQADYLSSELGKLA